MSLSVLDVDDVEGARMFLPVDHCAHPPTVGASSGHAKVSNLKLNAVLDLSSGQVKLDVVVHLGVGVRIADSSPVRSVQVWDTLRASRHCTNPAQLVRRFRGCDPVNTEASLDVIDDPEVLSSLLNLDDIHEPGGELGVGPRLPVNLYQALLHDSFHLLSVEGVLKTVLRKRAMGRDSPCLWGPELGLIVKTAPSLSSIHDLGAARRFKCFLGPLGILRFYFSCRSESSNISL